MARSKGKDIKRAEEITANELTDVKDIKNDVLYTKSHYVIGYMRLYPINIDLLSENEKENLCETLTGSFKDEKLQFEILVIPRTVDMERYLNYLSTKYDEEVASASRKMLLRDMLNQGSREIMDGQNFEHQFYLKIWAPYNANNVGIENKIKERLLDFQRRYNSIGNNTEILKDSEIIKLCNLFTNSNNAVFESYEEINYVPIPYIRKKVN